MTRPDLPLLVVVTGPPGAGKTAIARAVAGRLALPLVGKDAFKELLWERLGAADLDASRQLGRASFDLVFLVVAELLTVRLSVVAEGNFSRAEPFRELPDAHIFQLHVTASAETLRARYRNRPDRHAAHPDPEYEHEVFARMASQDWGPLDIDGELLRVDTTAFPDLGTLADRVAAKLATPSAS